MHSRCLLTAGFFVCFSQIKSSLDLYFLEGYYTYKPEKMLYNRLVSRGRPEVRGWRKKFGKENDVARRKKLKYSPELAGRMYLYFISYDDRGAPSMLKFAKSIGTTLAELQRYREHTRFDRAYRECQEIRRDYLIDRALDRRFDPSFVKFIISSEAEGEECRDSEMTLHLEVSE